MIKTSPGLQYFFHFLLLFGYFSVIVWGQTSLFRGYHGSNKDKDGGLIDDIPLTIKLPNGISMPLVGLGVSLREEVTRTHTHTRV